MDVRLVASKICEKHASILNSAIWSKIDRDRIINEDMRLLVQSDIYLRASKKISESSAEILTIDEKLVYDVSKYVNWRLRLGIYHIKLFIHYMFS